MINKTQTGHLHTNHETYSTIGSALLVLWLVHQMDSLSQRSLNTFEDHAWHVIIILVKTKVYENAGKIGPLIKNLALCESAAYRFLVYMLPKMF